MDSETLIESAIRVLNTADPYEKARLGDSIAVIWLQGAISEPYDPTVDLSVMDRPARLTNVLVSLFHLYLYTKLLETKNWSLIQNLVGETGVSEFDAEAGKSW